MNYIIGAGGVGSWLTPSLCLLTAPHHVTVLDGDVLEEKNLNRQLFTLSDLGKNKAQALAAKYNCQGLPNWFSEEFLDLHPEDWLICCADNNAARKAALAETDRIGCQLIIAANEKNSAEAYYYRQEWKGTFRDPRVYYDLSKDGDDPRRRAAGCTGEAQVETPQLVSANFMAASLAQWMYVLRTDPDLQDYPVSDSLAHLFRANLSRLENLWVTENTKTMEITNKEGQ